MISSVDERAELTLHYDSDLPLRVDYYWDFRGKPGTAILEFFITDQGMFGVVLP